MISVVFPGQGSQKTGMGLDLYKKFDYVKAIFNDADNILGYKNIAVLSPADDINKNYADKPINSTLLGLLLWPLYSNEHKTLDGATTSFLEKFKQIIKDFF